MFSNEYGEAAVEVLDILENTTREDVEKIPVDFIKFLRNNASKNYTPKIDYSLPLNELNLKEKTKEILGVIYINWWCDKEKKEEYKNRIIKNEKIKQNELIKKYNPNMFGEIKNKNDYNKIQEEDITKNKKLVTVKVKKNIFKQIIDKIIKFFTK